MYELSKNEFGKASPFFINIDNNRAPVFSIIEGNNPGKIYVDKKENSMSACVAAGVNPSDFFLAGNERNFDFNSELENILLNDIVVNEGDSRHVMFYSFSDEWKDALDDLLKGYNVTRLIRNIFTLDPELYKKHEGWQRGIPEGFRIEKMDYKLAERIGGIRELWGSIDNFLQKGFGFCVMKDDEIISNSQPVFIGDGRAEMAIHTDEKYRRQGFATMASCASIEYCLENNIVPDWGCFYNVASGGLAQKLGFAKKPDIQVSYIKLTRS